MAKFHCIHCGQRIDAPDELAGTDANCPACGGAITVPALPHATAPSTPPPLPATPPPLPAREAPPAISVSLKKNTGNKSIYGMFSKKSENHYLQLLMACTALISESEVNLILLRSILASPETFGPPSDMLAAIGRSYFEVHAMTYSSESCAKLVDDIIELPDDQFTKICKHKITNGIADSSEKADLELLDLSLYYFVRKFSHEARKKIREDAKSKWPSLVDYGKHNPITKSNFQ